MPYDEVIQKHLNKISDAIKATMSQKGLSATGAAQDSLEVDGNKLLGNDYIYYLDKGRKPGTFPPVDNIRDWVRDKLGITEEKEINQIAYLVGRKIKNEGTEIFKDNSKGIELDSIIEKEMEELMNDISDQAKVEAKTYLSI